MVPKLHDKGSSFKGIADYLLHDKDRATTTKRVAWAATRNLATDNPDLAWRIMAATALDQRRLKQSAGISLAGRKSDKHVLHLTLAWHPDQSPDREEILRAVDQALVALGASDRQVLIVCHNDEPHPHVHIVINRVSPTDGRHLSSSKEKLKLSQWAEAYEKETGIYCQNRIGNNALRKRIMSKPKAKRGAFVRCKKDTARHLYEAAHDIAFNDNDQLLALKAAQKVKDTALALRGRNQAKQFAAAWQRLTAAHEKRKAALLRQLQSQIFAAQRLAIDTYRPKLVALNTRQDAEIFTFLALEKSFFGRIGNAIKATREMVKNGGSSRIARAFAISVNASRRLAFFEEAQKREREALMRRQDDYERIAIAPFEAAHQVKMGGLRFSFLRERDELAHYQAAHRQQLQKAWAKRNADRRAAFAALKREHEALKPVYDQASRPPPPDQKTDDQRTLAHNNADETPKKTRKGRGVEAFQDARGRPARKKAKGRKR